MTVHRVVTICPFLRETQEGIECMNYYYVCVFTKKYSHLHIDNQCTILYKDTRPVHQITIILPKEE